MTELLAQHVEALAAIAPAWGFLLVFAFMAVESSFVPFPSEVVMIPAGFLAARGGLGTGRPGPDLLIAVACGVAGSLAGAWINYLLSRWLGRPFLQRHGRWFLLPPAKLARAEQVFRRYGAGATFFCRLLPGIRQLISIPAGFAGMRMSSFTLWTALGAGLWVALLSGVGYSIGARTAEMSYEQLVLAGEQVVRHDMYWIAPACLVALGGYVLAVRRIMAARP